MVYENVVKKLITKLSGVWVESEKKEILKELQEVYSKAKAFDEIVEIYSDNDHYSDEYVMETIQEQIDLMER